MCHGLFLYLLRVFWAGEFLLVGDSLRRAHWCKQQEAATMTLLEESFGSSLEGHSQGKFLSLLFTVVLPALESVGVLVSPVYMVNLS